METIIKLLLYFFLLTLPFLTIAQVSPECYVDKDFLIIHSTKDYKSALLTAQKTAKAFNIKLNLRGLIQNNDPLFGLTLPADTCLKYSEEYGERKRTCYEARGRWDDGIYISIEYSNAYDNFNKDNYIVIVGSGFKKDHHLTFTLEKVKPKYPDAYIKSSKIYLCCMH